MFVRPLQEDTMEMTELEELSNLIPALIEMIAKGHTGQAELSINNFYHRQARSRSDFRDTMKTIASHRSHIEADEHTKSAFAHILYGLDKRFNTFDEPICIMRIGNTYRVVETQTR